MRYIEAALVLVLGCGSSLNDAAPSASDEAGSGGGSASGGATGSGGSNAGKAGASGKGGASSDAASAGSDATAAGGSEGGGGTPDVVKACPAGDGAPGDVGVWEDITPSPVAADIQAHIAGGFAAGTQAVRVDPNDPATVYLGGDHDGIYKSTDCGATWAKANTGRNGAHIDEGLAWSMVIDPTDSEVLYAVNGYGSQGLWKTTNGGLDWDQLFTPDTEFARTVDGNWASIVSMDPTDHLHLVVANHGGCSGAYAPVCQAETKDGGKTWRLFKAATSGEGGGVMVINATTWLSNAWDGLYRTSDSGVTWQFIQVAKYNHYQLYRAKDGTYYLGSQQGVIKSNDGAAAVWSLIPSSGHDSTGLIGDGQRLFAGVDLCGSDNPMFTAPEDSPKIWTQMDLPAMRCGGWFLAYDPDHHILYTSNGGGGLWRVVTH